LDQDILNCGPGFLTVDHRSGQQSAPCLLLIPLSTGVVAVQRTAAANTELDVGSASPAKPHSVLALWRNGLSFPADLRRHYVSCRRFLIFDCTALFLSHP
jgi:hypothetical protein